MARQREPLIMIDRTAKTLSIDRFSYSVPVSDTDRQGFTHVSLLVVKKWTVPSGTTITQPADIELFRAAPGYEVHWVRAVILAAFDASVILGITDDTNTWIATGDLGEQTDGSVESSEHTNATGGAYFTAEDTIDLNVTGANITQGSIGIQVKYTDWGRFEAHDLE